MGDSATRFEVTIEGRGGELSVLVERPLILPLTYELLVALWEAAEFEAGRGIVNTDEVRRKTLVMRADHFGLGLELLIVVTE